MQQSKEKKSPVANGLARLAATAEVLLIILKEKPAPFPAAENLPFLSVNAIYFADLKQDKLMKNILIAAAFMLCAPAAFAQNKEQFIGCWKMASMGSEHIQLNRAGLFFFSDYNTKTKLYESLSGKWQLAGNKLTLLYEDRPKQTFTLRKNKAGAWELSKAGGFLFTKAAPSECSDVDGDGDGD